MRRSRLLVVGLNYAPELTGIAPYTAAMAQGLSRDHDVQVLTTHPHYPHWRLGEGGRVWRADEGDSSLRVTRLRHYVPGNPTGATRILSEASFAARVALSRVRRPDAIVCVSPALLSVAASRLLARRWRVPLGVVVQDLYGRAFEELDVFGGRLNHSAHRLERGLLTSATGLASIHRRMAETLVDSYGVSGAAITTIPNWAFVAAPTGDRAVTRRERGWAEDETIALHGGNMGAKQGLEHLLEAARRARETHPRLRFVLAGDGNQRQTLQKLSDGLTNVSFIDPMQGDLYMNLLAAADVLVLNETPGLREACAPSKLTSYFAAGRPVVAATVDGSAAAMEIEASGAGVVVPPGDPLRLIEAIDDIQLDGGAPFAARGVEYARTRLSEEAALEAYRTWVASLLAS